MSQSEQLKIIGAKLHNLQNISLNIPRNKLVVFTGPSGSGKSSLAFDTIYAEGQRRYVESLSSYARQFLSMMEKPEVDCIEGLSPAIAIEQKTASHNPRSTVGTITEIYDYLRLLFARIGTPHCPEHASPLHPQSLEHMVERLLTYPKDSKIMVMAPVIRGKKGEYLKYLHQLKTQGFIRVMINDTLYHLEDPLPELDPQAKHNISVIVDRLKIRDEVRTRLGESIQTALDLADQLVLIQTMDEDTPPVLMSARYACPHCDYSPPPLEPRLFSFNSPLGACEGCNGLGVKRIVDPEKIITHPQRALDAGAIRGWDTRHSHYIQTVTALAKHFDFTLTTPYQDLPEAIQQLLLYGDKKTQITFEYTTHRGRKKTRKRKFEGFIHTMERQYQETDSEAVRQKIAAYLSYCPCPDCQGSRLKPMARAVYIGKHTLIDWVSQPIDALDTLLPTLEISGHHAEIAAPILQEIATRLRFLLSVGLNYLTLDRTAETLSGGESQRIRLASQIGSGLTGVLYVLDEPSIGLHPRDNQRLLDTLTHLRDLGNTVLVVEHDEQAICQADWVVDMGPGAGKLGGQVVASMPPKQLLECKDSLTADYLTGRKKIDIPSVRKPIDPEKICILYGAHENNLKHIDFHLPVGLLTCITGVSGSGKSTLIKSTLQPLIEQHLGLTPKKRPGAHSHLQGAEHFDCLRVIDQSPIGRTPRSNPATYIGLFTPIRELFAKTEEARARGYAIGRFSFNVAGGRCETCQGGGLIKVEMHFLADLYVTCETCQGKRYNKDTLSIKYKGKTIHEVLALSVAEALEFFSAIPNIQQKCQTLYDVGLGYIALGQSATTLSGGEAQRIKLAKELTKRSTGHTLYLLDEPTTGLHFHDIKHLLAVLKTLQDQGNTLVIIEHNLDVIKTADWVIDLGPEGGHEGGEILATGTPEQLAKQTSYTGLALHALWSTTPPSEGT